MLSGAHPVADAIRILLLVPSFLLALLVLRVCVLRLFGLWNEPGDGQGQPAALLSYAAFVLSVVLSGFSRFGMPLDLLRTSITTVAVLSGVYAALGTVTLPGRRQQPEEARE